MLTLRLRMDGVLAEVAQFRRELPQRAQEGCTEQAQALQRDVSARAPKRTEALSQSVYVTASNGTSDYGDRTAIMQMLNPHADALPELPPPPGPGALVGVAAAYGWFVNYGTARQAGQPFWEPAVEQARTEFPARLARFVWERT